MPSVDLTDKKRTSTENIKMERIRELKQFSYFSSKIPNIKNSEPFQTKFSTSHLMIY